MDNSCTRHLLCTGSNTFESIEDVLFSLEGFSLGIWSAGRDIIRNISTVYDWTEFISGSKTYRKNPKHAIRAKIRMANAITASTIKAKIIKESFGSYYYFLLLFWVL